MIKIATYCGLIQYVIPVLYTLKFPKSQIIIQGSPYFSVAEPEFNPTVLKYLSEFCLLIYPHFIIPSLGCLGKQELVFIELFLCVMHYIKHFS